MVDPMDVEQLTAMVQEAAADSPLTGLEATVRVRAELERLEARRRALQEESRAFAEFVEELKRAKDREQFDAFMAKRRSEGGGPTIEA